MLKLFEPRPLKEKPEAEGEAELLVSPTGKATLILPFEGTVLTEVKEIVCLAVTGVMTTEPLL